MASATFVMAMNPAKYNSLPPDLKALLDKGERRRGGESFGKAWAAQRRGSRATSRTSKKGLIINHPVGGRHRQAEGARQRSRPTRVDKLAKQTEAPQEPSWRNI